MPSSKHITAVGFLFLGKVAPSKSLSVSLRLSFMNFLMHRCLALFAATLASASFASPAPVVERMKAFVDDGTISGAVTLVATHDRVLSLDVVGQADLANQKPMRA